MRISERRPQATGSQTEKAALLSDLVPRPHEACRHRTLPPPMGSFQFCEGFTAITSTLTENCNALTELQKTLVKNNED